MNYAEVFAHGFASIAYTQTTTGNLGTLSFFQLPTST